MKRVSRFIPSTRLLREQRRYTVNAKVFRRKVCGALCFAAAVGLFEMTAQFNRIGLTKAYFTLFRPAAALRPR